MQWITGTRSLTEKASELHLSRKQLSKRFKAFWAELPDSPAQNAAAEVLILDGVDLSGRTKAVLIARTLSNVHAWHFADRECFATWDAFLSHLSSPAATVIDGQKDLQKAVLPRFPLAHIQRCLVHVERFVRACVSRNPQTEAGGQLWRLVRSLWELRSQENVQSWVQQFVSWEARYAGFLAERNRSAETGRWWYTHRKLRSARSHLKKALPYLFTFIEMPGVPRTSNHVEGGVNARLRELIRRHRGLSPEIKHSVAAFFLASKTAKIPHKRLLSSRILIVSEGSKTEPNYFKEIRKALRLHSASVVVRPRELGTAPIQVVEYAEQLFLDGDRDRKIQARAFDQVFAVFDRDDHDSYFNALKIAEGLNRKLKNNKKESIRFQTIPSVPSFELWLLLHFEDIQSPIDRHDAMRRLKRHIPQHEKGCENSFVLSK